MVLAKAQRRKEKQPYRGAVTGVTAFSSFAPSRLGESKFSVILGFNTVVVLAKALSRKGKEERPYSGAAARANTFSFLAPSRLGESQFNPVSVL
jgi:hypothetical protein